MDAIEIEAAVVLVELPESAARNARAWDWRPVGRHRVHEVVARFGDLDRAREVAAGFNRQAMRSRHRRIWAALLEGEDAEQCGVGSVLVHGELVK